MYFVHYYLHYIFRSIIYILSDFGRNTTKWNSVFWLL